MAKAKKTSSTHRPTKSPTALKRSHSEAPDFSTVPDLYGMQVIGDCLTPLVNEGVTLVFSQTQRPEAGDLVALYTRADLVQPGTAAAAVKRLAVAMPSSCSLPYKPARGSDGVPVVICESINPQRRYIVSIDELDALHKCVGILNGGSIQPIPAAIAKS